MAEVMRTFAEPIRDASGSYHARVIGRRAPDGLWDGWLEFMDEGGRRAEPLLTGVESRQPNLDDLRYWAFGLSRVYAEGALARARRPRLTRRHVVEAPLAGRPAGRPQVRISYEPAVGAHPVMDPFEVGARSLDVLAQELGALGRARLLNIIAAYDLNPLGRDLSAMSEMALIGTIVAEVDRRQSRHPGSPDQRAHVPALRGRRAVRSR